MTGYSNINVIFIRLKIHRILLI